MTNSCHGDSLFDVSQQSSVHGQNQGHRSKGARGFKKQGQTPKLNMSPGMLWRLLLAILFSLHGAGSGRRLLARNARSDGHVRQVRWLQQSSLVRNFSTHAWNFCLPRTESRSCERLLSPRWSRRAPGQERQRWQNSIQL